MPAEGGAVTRPAIAPLDGHGAGDVSNGQTGTSSEHLDRTIDEVVSNRARPGGGARAASRQPELTALAERLAQLDPAAWERAAPLGPGGTAPGPGRRGERKVAGHRRRGAGRPARAPHVGRIAAVSAAALVVLAGVVAAATLAGVPAPRSEPGPTAVLAAWRLSGYIDQPAWRTGGTASVVGLAPTLTCAGGSTCFAVDPTSPEGAGVLESTTDGGVSWRSSVLPTGWRFTSGLACTSATVCSAGGLLGPGDPTATGAPAAVLTSEDGGGEWHAQPLPPAVATVTDLACGPGGHCVGSGLGPPTAGSRGVPIAVAGTAGSWSVEDLLPQVATAEPNGLACPTTRSCVLVGADTAGQSPTAAALFSDDAGATWTAAELPPGLADVRAVSCADAQHCLAVGARTAGTGLKPYGPSEALATSDGGRTWSVAGNLGTQSLTLASVSCTSVEDCWAAGKSALTPAGAVVSTSNDGTSWSAVQLPTSTTSAPAPGTSSGAGLVVENVSAVACTAGAGCTALGAGEFGRRTGDQVVLRSGPNGT